MILNWLKHIVKHKEQKGGRPSTAIPVSPPERFINIRAPTPEEGNRGSDGTNYAQAANPLAAIMPTQEQVNGIVAVDLIEKLRILTAFSQESDSVRYTCQAIVLSIAKNKDIPDEE